MGQIAAWRLEKIPTTALRRLSSLVQALKGSGAVDLAPVFGSEVVEGEYLLLLRRFKQPCHLWEPEPQRLADLG